MKRTIWIPAFLLLLTACNLPGAQPAANTPTAATAALTSTPPSSATPALPAPTTLLPASTQTGPPPQLATPATLEPTPGLPRPLPEEAILILEPGPGSRLPSPIHVSGMADPTFEQALVVRAVSADGADLALVPAQIQAEAGQRGPFAADLAVSVNEQTPVFLQVYATSPRDGGITHLSSVTVMVKPEGGLELRPVDSHLEHLVIDQPTAGSTVQGGTAHITGFGWASFEQALLAEVVGPDGTVIGSQSLLVQSSEMGVPGPFSVEVPYNLPAPGPGRIVIRDLSAAFGGDVHASSVEVNLEP